MDSDVDFHKLSLFSGQFLWFLKIWYFFVCLYKHNYAQILEDHSITAFSEKRSISPKRNEDFIEGLADFGRVDREMANKHACICKYVIKWHISFRLGDGIFEQTLQIIYVNDKHFEAPSSSSVQCGYGGLDPMSWTTVQSWHHTGVNGWVGPENKWSIDEQGTGFSLFDKNQ